MSSSLKWASTLLSSLFENGVRHAVISPGSRSTPLTLAAAIHPGIQKKVVLDERSAAFTALGIGKSTGIPAALICTSGTAVANYFPAVIEAKESGVPMIVLSADRPPYLRNLGSSQTTDQLKIFGDYTVYFHEAGEPGADRSDLKKIAYTAKEAVNFSIDNGGAAHINLPFRKPLEPDSRLLEKEKEKLTKFSPAQKDISSGSVREITFNEEISGLISSSNKPVLVAGPANPHQALFRQIEEFAGYLQAPVLAEPGSQAESGTYSVSGFDQFLRSSGKQKELRPDLIIRFGDQPYSIPLLRAFKSWDEIPVIQITARNATQDHAMTVLHKIICRKNDSINLKTIRPNTQKDWLKQWKIIGEEAETNLLEKLRNSDALTDGHVFNYFSKQLPESWNIMLSNSLPVRDMLTFGKYHKNQFMNRGAAGIDGILSTALGIHFSSNKPTCCFIGDLAFLHDSNALYTLQHAENTFVAIVINNNGGNIFRMLPVYAGENKSAPKDLYQTYFETPQNTDIRHLAKASSIAYQKSASLSDLKTLNLNEVKGSLIIECKTDPITSMNLRKELWKS